MNRKSYIKQINHIIGSIKKNEIHGCVRTYIKTDSNGYDDCIINTVSGLKGKNQLDKAYVNVLLIVLIYIWSSMDSKELKISVDQKIKYLMSKDLKNFDTTYLIYAMYLGFKLRFNYNDPKGIFRVNHATKMIVHYGIQRSKQFFGKKHGKHFAPEFARFVRSKAKENDVNTF